MPSHDAQAPCNWLLAKHTLQASYRSIKGVLGTFRRNSKLFTLNIQAQASESQLFVLRYDSHLVHVLTLIVYATGGFADACQSYVRALEIKEESPSAWDSLSMALVAQGQFHLAELADQHQLAALKASPELCVS